MTSFTASVCGSVIEVAAGEPFAISLEENPTTGYRWDFATDPGVVVISSSYETGVGGGVGGGGRRQFLFQADAAGEFVLRGRLMRSWLGDSSAMKRCEIKVVASVNGQRTNDSGAS
jgi:inhibitor of cysteine peptidase